MVHIRPATLQDLEILQKLSRQTFHETFAEANNTDDIAAYLADNLSLDNLRRELQNPDSEFYFAEHGAEVCGYLKINFTSAQTEAHDFNATEVERIYVLQQYLGREIGHVLLQKAIERAGEEGSGSVWLGVWEENKRAIRFYEKNGFITFGKHNFTLGSDVQTDILMKLTIEIEG